MSRSSESWPRGCDLSQVPAQFGGVASSPEQFRRPLANESASRVGAGRAGGRRAGNSTWESSAGLLCCDGETPDD